MSQYPSPYNTPNYAGYGYYPQQADHLAVARRASVLMFVLGGLVLLLGACNLAGTFVTPPGEIVESQREMMGQDPPFDPQVLRTITIAFAIATVVYGVVMILLGTLVRKGSMVSTVVGIIMTSLVLALLGLTILASLVEAAQQPVMMVFTCLFAIPAALHILLLVWLIQSIKGIKQQKTAEEQYRQNYWQYQQQYMQQQPTSGYGTPPPPPPSEQQ